MPSQVPLEFGMMNKPRDGPELLMLSTRKEESLSCRYGTLDLLPIALFKKDAKSGPPRLLLKEERMHVLNNLRRFLMRWPSKRSRLLSNSSDQVPKELKMLVLMEFNFMEPMDILLINSLDHQPTKELMNTEDQLKTDQDSALRLLMP